MNLFTVKLISSKIHQISSKLQNFEVTHKTLSLTSNWKCLPQIFFQVKFDNFELNWFFSSNPQPDLIYLKFLQIYVIFSFEVNKCQFSSKLQYFDVNHKSHLFTSNCKCLPQINFQVNNNNFEVNSIFWITHNLTQFTSIFYNFTLKNPKP